MNMDFVKTQGAGNDFIVLNNIKEKIPPEEMPRLAAHLCQRKLSLGANGLMAVDAPQGRGDIRMRFYNSDGTAGEMCGNGVRCLARYAYEHKLAGEHMLIETTAGYVEAWRVSPRQYKVRINDPEIILMEQRLELEGDSYEYDYIELGNPGLPHAVVRYPGFRDLPRQRAWELGSALRSHPAFPKGANVNFWQMLEDGTVLLTTFERGVEDFTLACGTGATATTLALHIRGQVEWKARLRMPGGDLTVEVEQGEDGGYRAYLTGDTNIVAEGTIVDEDLNLKS